MRFDDVVDAIPTLHALKRTASAHVVDYAHLGTDDLGANIKRVKNQFTHPEAVQDALDNVFHRDQDLSHRVLAPLIVRDILLNEHGYLLPLAELQDKTTEIEQGVVNESNEKDIKDLCGGRDDSEHYRNLSLYHFVLETAWKHRDTKSVDEANLLRKLRGRLRITEREHRLLEAMLAKYPKPRNEIHTREEMIHCIRTLQSLGLLFELRDNDGQDFVVIPEEVAEVAREVLGIEIRLPGYLAMLQDKRVRLRAYLMDALSQAESRFRRMRPVRSCSTASRRQCLPRFWSAGSRRMAG